MNRKHLLGLFSILLLSFAACKPTEEAVEEVPDFLEEVQESPSIQIFGTTSESFEYDCEERCYLSFDGFFSLEIPEETELLSAELIYGDAMDVEDPSLKNISKTAFFVEGDVEYRLDVEYLESAKDFNTMDFSSPDMELDGFKFMTYPCEMQACYYMLHLEDHVYSLMFQSDSQGEESDEWIQRVLASFQNTNTGMANPFLDFRYYWTAEEGDTGSLVMDKYLALVEYFDLLDYLKDQKEEIVLVHDPENYYLELGGDWDGNGSFTIFLDDYGQAQYYVMETKGCGPACTQKITFIEQQPYGYSDQSEYLLSKFDFEAAKEESFAYLQAEGYNVQEDDFTFVPLFKLPREGTTIQVYEQFSGLLLYTMDWTLEPYPQFVIERVEPGVFYQTPTLYFKE